MFRKSYRTTPNHGVGGVGVGVRKMYCVNVTLCQSILYDTQCSQASYPSTDSVAQGSCQLLVKVCAVNTGK